MHGPCRLPYELICNDKYEKNNSVTSLNKGYLLSTKDLCALSVLPKLIESGVMCFKIEGRMKTPEYVATVTRIYRKYIDLALSNNPYKIDKADINNLAQVFNRGNFSLGHLENKPNTSLVFPNKPNHMGIYIGNVSSIKSNKNHVFVNLTDSLSLGDTIQFEKESTKYTVSELMLKNQNVPTAKNQLVEIGRMRGNINLGDKIYRISKKELTNFAKASYQEEHKKVMLHASIVLKKDEPIILNIFTCKNTNHLFEGIKVSCTSKEVPIQALSKPIDSKRIIEQLNKTNNTIFAFDNIEVYLEDNLFLPSIKILNELRRNALEEIYLTAQNRIFRTTSSKKDLEQPTFIKNSNRKKEISLLLNILNQNENYENLKNVDKIYIPLKYFSSKDYKNILTTISTNYDTYIYLPTITKGNYKNLLNYIIDNSINTFNIKGFVISNLSNIFLIEEMKKKYKNRFSFIGNYTLNVFNTKTQQELKDLKIDKLTISPELDFKTIENIVNNSVINQELIVYGRTPLMSMNYCLLGKTNKCYPTCKAYCKYEKEYYLKDRLGLTFPIIPDKTQNISTIYNSKITSIDSSLFNVSSYRIDILNENVSQINNIIQTVLIEKKLEGQQYTNGNLNREI